MRKHLENGTGTLIALGMLLFVIIGAAITFGVIWGDVLDNKVLAADNENRIDIAESDILVEKSERKGIKKKQDEYNSAIKQILVSQAAQQVMVQNVQSSLRDIKRLLQRRPLNE